MADSYNSKFARFVGWFFGEKRWAVTIGRKTYYSCSVIEVTARPWWIRHEKKHKEQWQREGYIKYAITYIWYTIRYGYYDNPYEIEAREAEKFNGR